MVSGCVTARRVLWVLVFLGFAVNYMIRININIAIVAMVRAPKGKDGAAPLVGQCQRAENAAVAVNNSAAKSFPNKTEVHHAGPPARPGCFRTADALAATTTALWDLTTTGPAPAGEQDEGFDWDERQQGLVLGAFFWLHWVMQVPGGILARRYGTKLVFGLANLIPVLLTLAVPAVAYWDYRALLAVRFLQGLVAGFAWPSMHYMTAQWIPPNERSKFVTAYLGSSVGAALTFPLCGQLIHTWGWESVFYVCGALGVAWYVLWLALVFDSPAKHPRISPEELTYITESLGKSVSQKKIATPWRAILTSRAVWMNIVAQWGGVFGLFTLMTQAPTYFRYIHGWNIRMTGLLSGLPHLMRMLFAWVFSELGDYLLRKGLLSRTNVRKLATFFCDVVQGLLILFLTFSGCNAIAAIVFLTAATAAHGSVSTGPLASIVDISPNFCSIILGISGMISVLPGFISPIIVSQLTFQNQTVEQWQKVFGMTAAQLIVCGVLYCLFAQSELQPWNSPGTSAASGTDDKNGSRNGVSRASLPAIVISGSAHELQPLNGKGEMTRL
ncbi:Vesicular glutamate transporter 2.2 [Frankliniella fusca]|uniref:Vesicular glutamate transporter 2.2 n=1 Tax=Frankliniella fusca TaxID=407009 RepID=A0AAE1HDL2_9NEOP|nr:Vesicular glutamate transporter 2.2 [Frankliniella fusca]